MDLRVLAAAVVPAQTLSAATGGHLARSIRYRDVLPAAIVTLVHSATLDPHHQHRARVRTRTGAWLTAYAERLGPTLVSVILEPTRSCELAELRADAYRLTPREWQVAALAVQGRTNPEIAETLFRSVFTVQDHLKQIYTKTGATGCTDLNPRLFAQ